MQATVYEGYFDNGNFYVLGKAVQIPERRRIVMTIPEDAQEKTHAEKLASWEIFKQMVKDSAHENHLLDNDAFKRCGRSRELIDFSDGSDGL